jgi:MFS family permease
MASFLKRNKSAAVSEKGKNAEDTAPVTTTDVEIPAEVVTQHAPMTWRKFMAIFSLGCLLAAAQIPLYLIGGTLSNLPDHLREQPLMIRFYGCGNRWTGFVCLVSPTTQEKVNGRVAITYTLSLAAVCPFAGAVSDLVGRRYAAMTGALLVVVGMIMVGFAKAINTAIGGMAITGVGAGLAEVIGTAGISELAPVEGRGKYVGIAYALVLPFAASSGYGTTSNCPPHMTLDGG